MLGLYLSYVLLSVLSVLSPTVLSLSLFPLLLSDYVLCLFSTIHYSPSHSPLSLAKTPHQSDSPSCLYTSLPWACAPSFAYVVPRFYVVDTLHATRICKMNHVWLPHMSELGRPLSPTKCGTKKDPRGRQRPAGPK